MAPVQLSSSLALADDGQRCLSLGAGVTGHHATGAQSALAARDAGGNRAWPAMPACEGRALPQEAGMLTKVGQRAVEPVQDKHLWLAWLVTSLRVASRRQVCGATSESDLALAANKSDPGLKQDTQCV